MWLIPGKTKVKTEIFKGIGFTDIFVVLAGLGLVTLLVLSNIPYRYYIAIVMLTIIPFMLLKVDEEPNYEYLFHYLKHLSAKKHFEGPSFEDIRNIDKKLSENTVSQITAFTNIKDDLIEYGTDYYGAVVEIPAVEFRFFTKTRKQNSIVNGIGKVLRTMNPDFCANIIKIDRPVRYDHYINNEFDKLDELKKTFEKGEIKEEELKSRVEIIYDRIHELQSFNGEDKIYVPFYYLALYDSDSHQLEGQLRDVLDMLSQAELKPKRLKTKELALFLKYTNSTLVNEDELDEIEPEDYATWAMPDKIDFRMRIYDVNKTIASVKRIVVYPNTVSDAWLASVMSMPGTKVVVKCKPMDREKSVRAIDRSLNELRGRASTTGVDSKLMDIEKHIETLSGLLETLQGENETLMDLNVYVTTYDIVTTERYYKEEAANRKDLPRVNNFNKAIKRLYRENGLRLNGLDFQQLQGYVASQVSGYDPFAADGRGVPSNTISAAYPWIFANVSDKNGIKLGSNDGVPVFIDFFRRDSERVNSNMVIVGKSGSGKSYATKSLLTNLAADDAKVFILDPENEYNELAANYHGKLINVGNAQYGRMNPFHVITALDDDESDGEAMGSYETHLQFLEEFFKQILPDCEKDAREYLNSLIDRTYMELGINPETDLSKLTPDDFPTFDNLYDTILREFQETDNQYIRGMLRVLMNYIQKFATGGRNANIWNGPSTITTEEKFTVFNFQSLLSNRNNTIANAQMLLVLKYIDNEIIKNREYNIRNNAKRKVIVVVDEAHVFIDDKFPVALDFMYQLAKRIRKYNGMQIVITQNIKDFVGTEEIARKSAAIINACQYSFIFSLAPNDMDDLCKLYEKAGGINEQEQEQIVSAARGNVFTVLSPDSRAAFKIEVPENVVNMFERHDFRSKYFEGEGGSENWEEYIGSSRDLNAQSHQYKKVDETLKEQEKKRGEFVSLEIFQGLPKDMVILEEVKKPVIETPEAEQKSAEANVDYAAIASAIANNVSTDNRTEEKLAQLVERLSEENIELRISERIERAVTDRVTQALSGINMINPASAKNPIDEDDEDQDDDYESDDDEIDDFDFDDDDEDEDYEDEDEDDDDDDRPKAKELKAPVKKAPTLHSGDGLSLGSIFDNDDDDDDDIDDDDDPDDDELDEFDFDSLDDDDDDDDDDETSDFMKMFSEGVQMINKMSAIEMMDVYEETKAEITLEDLDKYILNVLINREGQA